MVADGTSPLQSVLVTYQVSPEASGMPAGGSIATLQMWKPEEVLVLIAAEAFGSMN